MEHDRGSVWIDLILYTSFALVTGVAIGLQAALASRPIGHETNWGSWADWTAATCTLVTAATAVVIARKAHVELARRNELSRKLAISIIATSVTADMEMAVRLSKDVRAPKTGVTLDVLIDKVYTFQLQTEPNDISLMAELPDDVLRSITSAKSILRLLVIPAKKLEVDQRMGSGANQLVVTSIIENIEVFAEVLMRAADYMQDAIAGEQSSRPWAAWSRPAGSVIQSVIMQWHDERG